VGTHLNLEQAHLVIIGKAFDSNSLAVGEFFGMPLQRIHAAVGAQAAPPLSSTWWLDFNGQ
jgi:hypothetical protein